VAPFSSVKSVSIHIPFTPQQHCVSGWPFTKSCAQSLCSPPDGAPGGSREQTASPAMMSGPQKCCTTSTALGWHAQYCHVRSVRDMQPKMSENPGLLGSSGGWSARRTAASSAATPLGIRPFSRQYWQPTAQ
jgi:hypothetical protein